MDSLVIFKWRRGVMNGYITVREVAKQWDISERQVQILCLKGRIKGATRFANAWAIPDDAVKPTRTVPIKPGRKPKKVEE